MVWGKSLREYRILNKTKKDTRVLNKRDLTSSLNLNQDEMLKTFGFELRKNIEIQAGSKNIGVLVFSISGESYYCFGNEYLGFNPRQNRHLGTTFNTSQKENLLSYLRQV